MGDRLLVAAGLAAAVLSVWAASMPGRTGIAQAGPTIEDRVRTETERLLDAAPAQDPGSGLEQAGLAVDDQRRRIDEIHKEIADLEIAIRDAIRVAASSRRRAGAEAPEDDPERKEEGDIAYAQVRAATADFLAQLKGGADPAPLRDLLLTPRLQRLGQTVPDPEQRQAVRKVLEENGLRFIENLKVRLDRDPQIAGPEVLEIAAEGYVRTDAEIRRILGPEGFAAYEKEERVYRAAERNFVGFAFPDEKAPAGSGR